MKPGGFYLKGSTANGFVFQFDSLKWMENGEAFNCLIQPRAKHGDPEIEWYPIITINESGGQSSGDLSMIRKENRCNQMNGTVKG